MSTKRVSFADPHMESALSELQAIIVGRWPAASFAAVRGEDPDGIYLDVTVDIDDPDEVMDVVVDRLLELQVNEGLPIHVVPLRTPERAVVLSQRHRQRTPFDASSLDTLLHIPL